MTTTTRNNSNVYDNDDNKKESKETLCFFGGIGFHSLMLQDFQSMHVRVGRIPPWKGVLNIPQNFQGSYRDILKGLDAWISYHKR